MVRRRILTWGEIASNVWKEIWDDGIFGKAAQLSYYFLLSLFPLLLLLTAVLGYLAATGDELRAALYLMLARFLPGSAYDLIDETVREITTGPQVQLISASAVGVLWSATNAMRSIIDGLNTAYELREDRPWWKWILVSIWLTIALAVLMISALVVLLYGKNLGNLLAERFGLSAVFLAFWRVFEWPFILGCVLLAFCLVYRYAPNVRYVRWKWIVPGGLVGMTLWLAVSYGFRLYLTHFDTYNKTYGSLGAVIILLFWFYLSGAAVLVGGEVNAELEYAAAREGDPEARLRGEKAPGPRPPDY